MRGIRKVYVASNNYGGGRYYCFPGLPDVDRGYIAGLIDGEGSLGTYSSGRLHTKFRLVISNTNRAVLEYVQGTLKIGGIYESTTNRKQGYKPVYHWSVQNQAGIFGVICELYTTLKIKKPTARKIIQLLSGKIKVRKPDVITCNQPK